VAPATILKQSLNGTIRKIAYDLRRNLISDGHGHSNRSADNFDRHSNARDSNARNITEML
jgi:hypothetical protein